MRSNATVVAVVMAWLGLCGAGLWQLFEHAHVPGAVGTVPAVLPPPIRQALGWQGTRPLLVLAAHPQCPCLPSTLDELTRVLADDQAIDLRVLVFDPAVRPPQWRADAFDTLCRGLPAGTVVRDRDGALAARLGAATSGHISLYAPVGALAFAGGITIARGHGGDNASARALRRVLAELPTDPMRTPVYGCPLSHENEEGCDARCATN